MSCLGKSEFKLDVMTFIGLHVTECEVATCARTLRHVLDIAEIREGEYISSPLGLRDEIRPAFPWEKWVWKYLRKETLI
jgi:hypothetical protein